MGVLHSKQLDSWEDSLDFGPVFPHDNNTAPTLARDYDIKLVKRFIREGRLAPFYQGYYEKPDNNNSQVDMLTLTAHNLLHTNSPPKQDSNISVLTLATQRMNFLLTSHIPENVQNYVLYKDTTECPICFLFYPPFINYTRCCNKPICTECFLQLKRSVDSPSLAIHCPFCMQSHLGVIRVPPPWSLHYASFCKRRSDFLQNQEMGKRKRLYIFDPDVVLVDHVRPDWQEHLGSSSSRNTSSNGSTRRAVVRPIQSSTVNTNPNSTNNSSDESLVSRLDAIPQSN
ncbi:hypothetical protein BC941DRAFT_416789 [Chlamydoabsidia padenii]|nr:hypothetical protein BC941DRAFT_416789 [Chlamydoabsidia padenii]